MMTRTGISEALEQATGRVVRLEQAVGAILELCDEHDWEALSVRKRDEDSQSLETLWLCSNPKRTERKMAKRFETKDDAQAAAALFPLARAIWIEPVVAAAEHMSVGWHVRFPSNVSSRYLCDGDVERAEYSASRHSSGWL